MHCFHWPWYITSINYFYLWVTVFTPQVDVPFIPKCKGAGDASNYDTYDEEDIKSSTTEKFAKEFADF